jgi:hypothetical protein
MKSTTWISRRMWIVTLQLAAVLGLTVMSAIVQPALAAEMDKSKFKEGCKEGKGSYVENRDGSFQCNTSGGLTIKCPDTKSQCIIVTSEVDHSTLMDWMKAGDIKMISPSNPKEHPSSSTGARTPSQSGTSVR